ncbi:hypothetical protein [Synechococcus sp. CBW1108]|uniref:hypothetical protein n=1 Tax=Synechococcus sp. CBW1108 TaxID=1353147 RepID=UPI0018CF3750|nr:hypothetical protein [Synechococcus sp. CBW1108]QPN69804.1 hypothetical protein H8F27_15225 [Synechococcus sp. CBW1108]
MIAHWFSMPEIRLVQPCCCSTTLTALGLRQLKTKVSISKETMTSLKPYLDNNPSFSILTNSFPQAVATLVAKTRRHAGQAIHKSLADWSTTSLPPMLLRALGSRLALFQHNRDPMAWEKLFAGFQGLGLISSKNPW